MHVVGLHASGACRAGALHCCHGFNEGGGQAPQPPITQARIGLLFDQLEPIQTFCATVCCARNRAAGR